MIKKEVYVLHAPEYCSFCGGECESFYHPETEAKEAHVE